MSLIGLMLSAPLIGIRKRWPHVLHAVEMDGLPTKTWPNGQAVAVCGVTHVRLPKYETSDGIEVFGLWPPAVRSLPKGWTRGKACAEGASKKRPRTHFELKALADA